MKTSTCLLGFFVPFLAARAGLCTLEPRAGMRAAFCPALGRHPALTANRGGPSFWLSQQTPGGNPHLDAAVPRQIIRVKSGMQTSHAHSSTQ